MKLLISLTFTMLELTLNAARHNHTLGKLRDAV